MISFPYSHKKNGSHSEHQGGNHHELFSCGTDFARMLTPIAIAMAYILIKYRYPQSILFPLTTCFSFIVAIGTVTFALDSLANFQEREARNERNQQLERK